MANRTATLYLNCKVADGKWRFYPVSKAANGRLEPGVALVNGRRTKFDEFNYYVSWYEGTDENGKQKKRFEKCGTDATFAAARRMEVENHLNSEASPAQLATMADGKTRVTIADAAAIYINDAKHKAEKTFSGRRLTMGLFTRSCTKAYVDQIGVRDMLDFKAFLHKEGYGARTVFNHFETANSFLRANGILAPNGKSIVPKHEWPKYNEKPVKKYQPAELKTLYAEADSFEKVVFKFFETSGGREGEVARLQWKDIDWKNNMVWFVSREGASTKNRKSRSVPLPDTTIAMLRQHQKEYGDFLYVFPNGQGAMEGHFLRILKNLAYRAGLNCGHCHGVGERKKQKCKDSAVCGEWELHRFRKTCASTWLHANIHIRKIQKWLGHHSLDVTLGYLADEEDASESVREEVNAAFD